MFNFVTVNHPSELKEQKRQTGIRQHAIRSALRSKQAVSAKRNDNFVAIEMNKQTGKLQKRFQGKELVRVARPIDAEFLDPFDALYGSGKQLRMLMSHKSLQSYDAVESCSTDAGRVFSNGMNAVFLGSLTDPKMFQAMSLVLSSAMSSEMSNVEALKHRGSVLKEVRRRMADAKLVPSISTLTAILLLIGSEYRVDGSNAGNIPVHIRAVQDVLNLTRTANTAISGALQRALYWHDLYSCLFTGTPRFLSQESYAEFSSETKLSDFPGYFVPTGFRSIVPTFPSGYRDVLRELNVLCQVLEAYGSPGALSNDEFPFSDLQYCIQSRLVDLLCETESVGSDDPIYKACIFATFLCTYMLSIGIWKGCFIPDYCAIKVLDFVSQAKNDPRLLLWKELLLWLLVVSGALTRRSVDRAKALVMIRASFHDILIGMYDDWEQLETKLRTFIWSDRAMERYARRFWEKLRE